MAIAEAVAERLKGRNHRPEKHGNISTLTDQGATRDLAAAKAGFGSGKTLEAAQAVIAQRRGRLCPPYEIFVDLPTADNPAKILQSWHRWRDDSILNHGANLRHPPPPDEPPHLLRLARKSPTSKFWVFDPVSVKRMYDGQSGQCVRIGGWAGLPDKLVYGQFAGQRPKTPAGAALLAAGALPLPMAEKRTTGRLMALPGTLAQRAVTTGRNSDTMKGLFVLFRTLS